VTKRRTRGATPRRGGAQPAARALQPSRIVRLLPLLLASAAHAQVGDVTVKLYYNNSSGESTLLDDETIRDYFGLANCECGTLVRAVVDIGTLTGVSNSTDVQVRGGKDCNSTDSTVRSNCKLLHTFQYSDFAATTQETSFTLDDILNDATACAAREEELGIFALVDQGSDGVFEGVGFRKFQVDTSLPTAPTEDTDNPPAPGDGAVQVSWKAPDNENLGDTGGYQVFCERDGAPVFASGQFDAAYRTKQTECSTQRSGIAELDPDFLCSDLVSSGARDARIGPLENGVSYDFYVVAVDSLRNPSTTVSLGSGTPEATEDFYEHYVNAGGTAQGGFCSMGGGHPGPGAATLLAALFLVLSAFRRRPARLALVALSASLIAAPARAQENRFASPQHFCAELKFGPYRPDVDSQFANAHPYQDVFGDDKSVLTQFELDWQFLPTPIASLGAGLLYGFFWETAGALTDTGAHSKADETSLRAHTLAALLVLRVDALRRYAHVPLVPYGKIGLDYYIWWVTEGDGSVANCPSNCPFAKDPQDIKARGGAWGWQASPGLALLLDVFDPRAAKMLDSEMGINHTYAFFELLLAEVDNFNASDKFGGSTLHLGDRTWTAGLAFEF
jgi:hypothetical protein